MNDVFNVVTLQRSPRYREVAFSAIKEAILEGKIAAGEPLVEVRIAGALGMSRTPVREALALLEHEGLIEHQPGTGLVIRELSREEFKDMFVANELVEPQLVRRAAVYATQQHLGELQGAIDLGKHAAIDGDILASLRSGREFHRWVGIAAGNPPLARFVLRNEEQTDLFLLSLGNHPILTAEELAISNHEHQDILDALRRRDPEDASRLVIYHAQSLRRRHAHLFRSSHQPTAVGPNE
ncbi:MAG TPA: GntR family transcriptional regulator [Thermomicrobiales bacterium]|nr:GntR family transcriptional regulator [Thermomicrobiales bacterium]